jgi:DNA-binding GntR family transcriptional regulator
MLLASPMPFTASDPEAFRRSIEQNKKFHVKIAAVTGNKELVTILSNILDKIHRTQYLEAKAAPKPEGPEHQLIADAIARHDPAAAEEAMNAHIQTALDRLLSVAFNWTN